MSQSSSGIITSYHYEIFLVAHLIYFPVMYQAVTFLLWRFWVTVGYTRPVKWHGPRPRCLRPCSKTADSHKGIPLLLQSASAASRCPPVLARHSPIFTEQQAPAKTPSRLCSKSYIHLGNWCKSSFGLDPCFVPMKGQ